MSSTLHIKRLFPVIVKEKVKTYRRELLHTANLWTPGARKLPDFIIIGSQKSGTTSLFDYLVQHPRIRGPLTKEIHYFDLNFTKSIDWYQAFFPKECEITGEATPYYMHYPHSIRRISETLPSVKLFILLRNPVDRAYSAYQHQIWKKRETLSFPDALKHEAARTDGEFEKLDADEAYYSLNHHHFTYLERGIYHTQIERCFEYFPREQVMIIESSTFYGDTEGTYAKALNFLGLEAHKLSEYRNVALRKYEPMSDETRQWLIDYYRPHNERLYQLLDRRFDWDK
ncbi:MAG: sulfotransferase domain-containing protein [Planctomycetota bacterium]